MSSSYPRTALGVEEVGGPPLEDPTSTLPQSLLGPPGGLTWVNRVAAPGTVRGGGRRRRWQQKQQQQQQQEQEQELELES